MLNLENLQRGGGGKTEVPRIKGERGDQEVGVSTVLT